MNTNLSPSGDQAGWQAPSGMTEICRCSVPSTLISQICGSPVTSETKAIGPDPPPTAVGASVGVRVGRGVCVGVRRGVAVSVPLRTGASVAVGSNSGVGEVLIAMSVWGAGGDGVREAGRRGNPSAGNEFVNT